MEHKKVIEKFVNVSDDISTLYTVNKKPYLSVLHMYILQAIKDWWWEWPWNEASIIVSSCFVGCIESCQLANRVYCPYWT